MNTFLLRKRFLWSIFCIVLFFIFIKQDKLSNSTYNQNIKEQSYCVEVTSIKKAREYYVYGTDRKGQPLKLVISSKWNLHTVQVGDSLIKRRNSFDIKLVSKNKSRILIPELPL